MVNFMQVSKTLISIVVVTVFVCAVAFAAGQSRGGSEVSVPAHAIELAPGLYDLGPAVIDGKVVHGLMHIHYKKGYARPGIGGSTSGDKCYAHISRGAKWKSLEGWVVNPTNTRGLDGLFVFDNLAGDISKWESSAGKDIFSSGVLTSSALSVDTASPDNVNEVMFGSISEPGAIAVTVTWGNFGGPVGTRQLVEWDMIFDENDFDWSSAGEAGKMDFENIATHELGHALGMDHPSSGCTEETMYAYASYGETKKRDLNTGDKAGILALYK